MQNQGREFRLSLAVLGFLLSGALAHSETNQLGMELVPINPGTLQRGMKGLDSKDLEGHREYFYYVIPIQGFFENEGLGGAGWHIGEITKPFHIGAKEVTVGQFRKFVEATGYVTDAEWAGEAQPPGAPMLGFTPPRAIGAVKTFEELDIIASPEYSWRNPGFEQTDDHPVVGVSWNDALAFCKWLSEKEGRTYRLPTELEWEYACRAGTIGQGYWFGPDPNQAYRYANIGTAELEKAYPKMVLERWIIDPETTPSDGFVYTAPVGSFPPSPWGLFDIHGNVFEWCQDTYSITAYKDLISGNPKDESIKDPLIKQSPTPGVEAKVIRGGSFYSEPFTLMAGTRSFFLPGDSACYIGFRVVKEDS